MQVNVIKPDTVLVNWTLGQHLLHHQLQLQIVYNPVQASYYIVHPVLNPATEFVYLENLQPFTSYQLVMRTANLSSVFLTTETNYFSTSGISCELSSRSGLFKAAYLNQIKVLPTYSAQY